jgi:hypothetical protein
MYLGLKGRNVIGGREKLHNKGLRKLYYSPNNVSVVEFRNIRPTEHLACIGDVKDAYTKPEGRKVHGRPRRGWEYNINVDIIKMVMSIWSLAQDRNHGWVLVNTYLRLP